MYSKVPPSVPRGNCILTLGYPKAECSPLVVCYFFVCVIGCVYLVTKAGGSASFCYMNVELIVY